MSNSITITLASLIFSSIILAGCSNKSTATNSLPTTSPPCEKGASCTLSGTLKYYSTVRGAVFELTPLDGEEDICIARDGVPENRLIGYAGKSIKLLGKIEDFVEIEGCAAMMVGESELPCGYCGEKVFVAIGVAK